MNQAVTDLQTAVANETTVNKSVLTLIQTLAGNILNSDDITTIKANAQAINDNAAALAAAVTANTPAAPQA